MPEGVCRACGGEVVQVLDLGCMPLADALFVDRANSLAAERYPLRLGRCEQCHWVSLLERPPREVLFPSDYPYFSTVSEAVSRSAQAHAEELIHTQRLGPGHRVLEIASNDGYQLQWFQQAGIEVLGIDPAPGPVAAARAQGIPTREAFFDAQLARQIHGEAGQADVILAKNVLAHVSDPGDFLAGVRCLLKPGGLASFEFPWLATLLKQGQFDTIYHEHASYLAIAPLRRLLARFDLRIAGIREIDLHGGSLRVDVCRAAAGELADAEQSDRDRYLRYEEQSGVNTLSALNKFAAGVELQIIELRAMVQRLQAQGLRLAAYGAAAKGVTLLNACQLDYRHIDFVVDRSPHKIGRFMAGTGIEIRSTHALLEQRPDVVLLLAWNFVDEIRRQQAAFESAGGRWLLPIPQPQLIGSAG